MMSMLHQTSVWGRARTSCSGLTTTACRCTRSRRPGACGYFGHGHSGIPGTWSRDGAGGGTSRADGAAHASRAAALRLEPWGASDDSREGSAAAVPRLSPMPAREPGLDDRPPAVNGSTRTSSRPAVDIRRPASRSRHSLGPEHHHRVGPGRPPRRDVARRVATAPSGSRARGPRPGGLGATRSPARCSGSHGRGSTGRTWPLPVPAGCSWRRTSPATGPRPRRPS